MALPWALAVLSLLPLLDAQSSSCTNFSEPITNASIDQISHKWFYIASAHRHPNFKDLASKIRAEFFYVTANQTEDTLHLREYITVGDECFYNVSQLKVLRENGTLVKYDKGTEYHGQLRISKDPKTFMLAFFPGDEKNVGLSLYADKPEVTPEQLEEFFECLSCLGMEKSEVMYSSEKKDLCAPLEKAQEEEKKKGCERPKTDSPSD